MQKQGFFWQVIGLSSPAGRLTFVLIVSAAIFLLPNPWPVRISLWDNLNIPSPSIGLTRSYRKLVHGNFSGAWRENKLIYPVVAVGVSILARDAFKIATRQK